MKMYWITACSVLMLLLVGCACAQSKGNRDALSAEKFSDKIKELPQSPIVDVRTPDEFAEGHLFNAINIDWKNENFVKQITTLDKSIPIFVYCRSGRRSADAANKMRSEGFLKVYELNGGILEWQQAGLPIEKD